MAPRVASWWQHRWCFGPAGGGRHLGLAFPQALWNPLSALFSHPAPRLGEASSSLASSRRPVGARAGGREKVRAEPEIRPSLHGATVSRGGARLRAQAGAGGLARR